MLKEALEKQNSELKASRSMWAKTLSKLQTLEAQVQPSIHQKGSPTSTNHMNHESIYSQNTSYSHSMISISEDGNNDARSYVESWSTTLISELSQFTKERNADELGKSETIEKLELMDDFLEVEKFIGLLNDSIEDASASFTSNNNKDEIMTNEVSKVSTSKDDPSEYEKNDDLNPLAIQVSHAAVSPNSGGIDGLSTAELQSRIQSVFESVAKDIDVGQILKDIKHLEDARVLEDTHDTSIQDSVAVTPHDVPPSDIPCDKKDNSEDVGSVAEKELISFQEPNQYIQITCRVEHLLNAIGNLELTGPYAEALSQLSYKLEDVAHLVHHLQLYIFIILESGVLNE